VTALALHGGVLAGQTVFCLLVFTDGENRRDELGLVVARFALPAVRPMHELPFVNVLMAIQTAGMSQRLMAGVSTFSTRSVLIPLLQQVNRRRGCASVYCDLY
jgi:hypothetical protein